VLYLASAKPLEISGKEATMHAHRFGPGAFLVAILASASAAADVPSTTLSYYVPQAGPVASPVEGQSAITFFRMCPNNDGGTSLPNSARIKVVVRNAANLPIVGVAAQDVGVLLNGGTALQGFSGVGADSVISNSQFNPLCPDVRWIHADAPTDAAGETYITFTGANVTAPGVGLRDVSRKWGHYDSELPVYVVGFKFHGRLTSASANDTYTLRIKNLDWTGGLGAAPGGEAVTVTDFNGISNTIGIDTAWSYWKDFDSAGGVAVGDLNLMTNHLTHDCNTPNDP
jgi:hypothetical protein